MTDRMDPAFAAADDWLDQLLAADGVAQPEGYIADDGFTARVLQSLPAPVVAPAWRKPVVWTLWGVAAAGLVVAMPSAMLDVGREAYRLLAAHPVSLSGIAAAALAMVGLTSAAAAYTLRAGE
jgi:hypothetical protein